MCEDSFEFPASVPVQSRCLYRVKSRGWFTGTRWSLDPQDLQPQMDDCDIGKVPLASQPWSRIMESLQKSKLKRQQHLLSKHHHGRPAWAVQKT